MDYMQLIKDRYSCRQFDAKAIGEDDLHIILEAGRLAPTAKNLQGVRISVVRSEEGLAKIDALTPCRYGAPVVLILSYDSEQIYTLPGGKYDTGAEDAAIVATHLVLAAKSLGIDSCWVNNLNPDEVAKAFALAEGEVVTTCIDLGYAAADAQPAPRHEERKPMEDLVRFF